MNDSTECEASPSAQSERYFKAQADQKQHQATEPQQSLLQDRDLGLDARRDIAVVEDNSPSERSTNICPECDLSFARHEHLKRHIHSLHVAPNIHNCQFCGKNFSRSDVLLRHYQSCTEAKDRVNLSSKQIRKRAARACQGCAELKIRCTGEDNCMKCVRAGRKCVYKKRSNHNRRHPERKGVSIRTQIGRVTSSLENHVNSSGDGNGLSSPPFQPCDEDESPSPSSNITTGFTPGASDCLERFSQSNESKDWSPSSESVTLQYPPRITSQQDGLRVCSNQQTLPPQVQQVTLVTCEANTEKSKAIPNKRGTYGSNTCTNCKKRKVKCDSGTERCTPCVSGDLECVRSNNKKGKPKAPIPNSTESNPSYSLLEITERLAKLEKEVSSVTNHRTRSPRTSTPTSQSSQTPACDSPSSESWSVAHLPSHEFVYGLTCPLQSIDAVDRALSDKTGEPTASQVRLEIEHKSDSIEWEFLPRCNDKNLKMIERQTRDTDISVLHASVDIYFSQINPQYPCLNENQFRNDFTRFIENDMDDLGDGERYQFVALVNLIQAEVKILCEKRSDSTAVAPGWTEYCRAEDILKQLTWLGNGDISTLQCLLVKSIYLFYVEKVYVGHDALGNAVRLAFRLGLHNQRSWNCTPFATIMRQRLFWTMFILDRHLALNGGIPFLMRDSDFNVDFPDNYDDKLLFPGKPLPDEFSEISCSIFLSSMARWAKLFGEIWDVLYGIKAQRPVDEGLVASLDARIVWTATDFPAYLKWNKDAYRLLRLGNSNFPDSVLHQRLILHLRLNQLRLLLRQESLTSGRYSTKTAEECMTITSSSVDAISDHMNSRVSKPTHRWYSVLYLVGCLMPLTCIIVQKDNDQQLRARAIESFDKAFAILNNLTSTFTLARHTVLRLNRIMSSVTKAIRTFEETQMSTSNREKPENAHKPQFADFMAPNDLTSNPELFFGQPLIESYNFNMDFAWDYVESTNADSSGGLDYTWLDNFLDQTNNL